MEKHIFLFLIIGLCSLPDIKTQEALLNNPALEQMAQKICRIAREKLNIQNPTAEDIEMVLNYVKDRLKTTPLALHTNTDEAKLIAQAISLLSNERNYLETCYGHTDLGPQANSFPGFSKQDLQTNLRWFNLENDKGKVKLNGILMKLEKFVAKTMRHASIDQDKREIVEVLKRYIIDKYATAAANEGRSGIATKEYIKVISDHIDNTRDKILAKEARRSQLTFLPRNEELIAMPEIVSSRPAVSLTKSPDILLDKDDCDQAVKQTCNELTAMESYKCISDDISIKAQQVCDGVVDCSDGSDERNCLRQVIKKVHSATQVMSQIETSRSCYKSMFESSVISRQGTLLTELLKSQIAFIKRYAEKNAVKKVDQNYQKSKIHNSIPKGGYLDITPPKRRLYHHDETIDEVVSQVALILRTFGTSLRGALCIPLSDSVKKAVETPEFRSLYSEINNVTKHRETSEDFSPDQCKCSGPDCIISSCPWGCKIYCSRMHLLRRFKCKSVDQREDSVLVDYVCDGKVDCFDESDEMGCTAGDDRMAKFESTKYFDTVINIIKKKFLTKGYQMVQPTLAELQEKVNKLHKHCMTPIVNFDAFKRLRNRYYELVNTIYEEALDNLPPGSGPDSPFAEEVFDFLMDINVKMIEGMKRTHTGNTKVMLSDQNCQCRGAECKYEQCTIRCKRTCLVQYLFTNYFCGNTSNQNDTKAVPIDALCDGRAQCPAGEDEAKCSKEICRIHHARVLRMNIQAVGEKSKGTLMGDALNTWKETVAPSLLVLEQRERVTPRLLKNTVQKVANDLSLAYMTLEQFRRLNTEPILKKFTKLSQRLIESVKTCTM